MTERDLLNDLLKTPPEQIEETMESAQRAAIYDAAPLSPENERALLRAAADAGPVTLAEQSETGTNPPEVISDVMGFVRRYPLQTALAVAGAAYLLARRRK